jgi:outer membrane protein assembly factor BamB
MTTIQAVKPSDVRLRIWPGLAIVTAQLLLWLAIPFVPQGATNAIFGGIVCALLAAVWWLFFSRAPWLERFAVALFAAAALYVTRSLVDRSISNGMMGMMLPVMGTPIVTFALALAIVTGSRLSSGARRAAMVVGIVVGCLMLNLVRTGGISGGGNSDLHWRWTLTPEQRLLAEVHDDPAPIAAAPASADASTEPVPAATSGVSTVSAPATPPMTRATEHAAPAPSAIHAAAARTAEWPGFRGPERDSVIHGVRIETDWTKSAPVELWRHPIGPGWSSFAVSGDLIYTQEQRGDDEIVAAYKRSNGEPVWRHRDPVRFWESNGGAGPRATPTLSNGRAYTFGATGILNALDAATGAVIWSKDVASETSMEVPEWGFASSPLVVDDVVVVAADARLAGYDLATGRQRWVGPVHRGSYSSPHRVTIDGVVQVVLIGGAGAISVAPADGTILWQHSWLGTAIVQPAVTSDGNILVNTIDAMGGNGVRRIAPVHGPGGWTVEERWTSNGLKPYFNDFVVHKGHAFGFDGSILACIDLQDGKRVWKGGRYGNGQLVLLPDEDLLLVLSEEGELALVNATPDQFKEIARSPALDGKTWNHPVLVGDTLFVRNGQEMAAFRLSLAH